jgi:predicted phosphodiesterase
VHAEFGWGEKVFYSVPKRPSWEVLGVAVPPFDGWLHEVPVTFPAEAQTVTVTVANGGPTIALPLPQPRTEMTIAVLGDNRTDYENHKMVVDEILAEQPLVVLNTGDLVSGGGDVARWQKFFAVETMLVSSSWYFATVGNHDDILGLGLPYFNSLWHTEGGLDGSNGTYALDLGLVGLVVIDKYTTDWSGTEAQAWLEEKLAELAPRPWLFFMAHPPLYSFSYHGPWTEARTFIQPLLEKYGVDLVIAGHNHCYEHFYVNGLNYVVSGGGGAPLYDEGDGPEEELPLLVTGRSMYHYLRLDVSQQSIDVTVIEAATGEVFEQFVIEP